MNLSEQAFHFFPNGVRIPFRTIGRLLCGLVPKGFSGPSRPSRATLVSRSAAAATALLLVLHGQETRAASFTSQAGDGDRSYAEEVAVGVHSFTISMPPSGLGIPFSGIVPDEDGDLIRIDVEWKSGTSVLGSGKTLSLTVERPMTIRALVTKYRKGTSSVPIGGGWGGPVGTVEVPTQVYAGQEEHEWVLEMGPTILRASWVPPLQVPSGSLVTLRAEVTGFSAGDTNFLFLIREDDGTGDGSFVALRHGLSTFDQAGRRYVETQWKARWMDDAGTDPEYFVTVSHLQAPNWVSSSRAPTNELQVFRAERTLDLTGDLDFGVVAPNTRLTNRLFVSNLGNAPLLVSRILCPPGFEASPSSVEIPALTIRPVQIVFHALDGGVHQGVVEIQSNADLGDNLIEARAEVPLTRILRLSTDALDFGKLNTRKTLELTVHNDGNSPLHVGPWSMEAPWDVAPAVAEIGARTSAVFRVSFEPLATRSYSTNAPIRSDKTEGAGKVMLSGAGTTDHTAFALSTTQLDFGKVAVRQEASRTVVLVNTGETDLTVKSVTATAGFRAVWKASAGRVDGISPPGGVVVPPGKGLSVSVVFAPTLPIRHTGQVVFTTDSTRRGGNVVSVAGAGVVRIEKAPPVLSLEVVKGEMLLAVSGAPGTPYVLEKTSLVSAPGSPWREVASLTPSNSVPVWFRFPSSPVSAEFYRARMTP